MIRSALYVGHVMHHRLTEPQHRFRYRVYYHLIDLDELPQLDDRLRLFGHRRRRPVRFRDADHLGDPARDTGANVRAYLADQGVETPIARIALLTQCRVFGFVFNPVSFDYCYAGACPESRRGASEDDLVAIVVEVHNTFGERHCYRFGPSRPCPGTSGTKRRSFTYPRSCRWRGRMRSRWGSRTIGSTSAST